MKNRKVRKTHLHYHPFGITQGKPSLDLGSSKISASLCIRRIWLGYSGDVIIRVFE